MAKNKSKVLTFTTLVRLPNMSPHTFYFRKMKERDKFTALAKHVTGVAHVESGTVVYIYEEAENAINTLMNYTDRIAKV